MKLVNEVLKNHILAMPQNRHLKVDEHGFVEVDEGDVEALLRVGFKKVPQVIKEKPVEPIELVEKKPDEVRTFKRKKNKD